MKKKAIKGNYVCGFCGHKLNCKHCLAQREHLGMVPKAVEPPPCPLTPWKAKHPKADNVCILRAGHQDPCVPSYSANADPLLVFIGGIL